MQQATLSPATRGALAGHLSVLGLPPDSSEGLLSAMERGLAAGEPDAFELRDRLIEQATSRLVAAVGTVADEIADVVISPTETLGGKA